FSDLVRRAAGKPDQGTISLNLSREGGEMVLTLADDGGGIRLDAVRRKAIERRLMAPDSDITDHEILQFILAAGFSTAEKITQISGRGVGLDVVTSEIKQLGGSVSIESAEGQGTRFIIRLPFTVSVNRALMVHSGEDLYAVPLSNMGHRAGLGPGPGDLLRPGCAALRVQRPALRAALPGRAAQQWPAAAPAGPDAAAAGDPGALGGRSEERRVGKEGSSRRAPDRARTDGRQRGSNTM